MNKELIEQSHKKVNLWKRISFFPDKLIQRRVKNNGRTLNYDVDNN